MGRTGRKTLETGNVVVRRTTLLTGLTPTHHNGQARGRVSSNYFGEAAAHRIHWNVRCKCPRIDFAGLILKSGRATSVLDGCHVLGGKRQRFIDAGCNAGEGALNRERPGLDCGSDGGRGVKAVGCNDRSSDVSHLGDEIQ